MAKFFVSGAVIASAMAGGAAWWASRATARVVPHGARYGGRPAIAPPAGLVAVAAFGRRPAIVRSPLQAASMVAGLATPVKYSVMVLAPATHRPEADRVTADGLPPQVGEEELAGAPVPEPEPASGAALQATLQVEEAVTGPPAPLSVDGLPLQVGEEELEPEPASEDRHGFQVEELVVETPVQAEVEAVVPAPEPEVAVLVSLPLQVVEGEMTGAPAALPGMVVAAPGHLQVEEMAAGAPADQPEVVEVVLAPVPESEEEAVAVSFPLQVEEGEMTGAPATQPGLVEAAAIQPEPEPAKEVVVSLPLHVGEEEVMANNLPLHVVDGEAVPVVLPPEPVVVGEAVPVVDGEVVAEAVPVVPAPEPEPARGVAAGGELKFPLTIRFLKVNRLCYNCFAADHRSAICPNLQFPRCIKCGNYGHRVAQCRSA